MAKRASKSERLEPLNWYPRKIYGYDDQGVWRLTEDEALTPNKNDFIKNYSGGVSIDNIHKRIRPLKADNYKLLGDDVGGDAPKDFISVYEYEEERKSKPQKWAKHIAKVGHKWYPLESISEHLLNRIGEVMRLNMAKSQLRLAHGQLRFLSRYFLDDGENMMHGAQIYSTYLEESDTRFVQEIENQNWARALLTFQFTDEAVKFVFPQEHPKIMNFLVELLVFDAITGNNDRHFYNWAVITHVEGKNSPKFSPIYDSARGLFWNKGEDTIDKKFYEKRRSEYVINDYKLASYMDSSRPKIGWEGWQGEKEINHFQLVANINKHYPQYKNTCNELIKEVHLQSILELLEREFITFYTPRRFHLIKECLKRRFEILDNLCKFDCDD